MSVRVMAAVFAAPIRPPSRKLVALALADAADDDGRRIFPGEERLVRRTGLAPRTVRDHVASLIDGGILVEVRRAHTGVRREFRIVLDRLRELAALGESAREAAASRRQEAATGSRPSPKRGGGLPPERWRSPAEEAAVRRRPNVLTRPQPSEKTLSRSVDRFDEFYSAYPRKVGPKAARRAWDKALRDGATATQILAGVRRYAADPNLPTDRRFIPHPARWLNGGRWEDEPEPGSPAFELIRGLQEPQEGDP